MRAAEALIELSLPSAIQNNGSGKDTSCIEQPTRKVGNPPGVIRFSCSTCKDHYASKNDLVRHIKERSVRREGITICHICSRIYRLTSTFAMHVQSHVARHACPFCGKIFSRLWSLKTHKRIHTGERPYSCYICCRTFTDGSNMRAHILTHRVGQQVKCPKCGEVFQVSLQLALGEQRSPCHSKGHLWTCGKLPYQDIRNEYHPVPAIGESDTSL